MKNTSIRASEDANFLKKEKKKEAVRRAVSELLSALELGPMRSKEFEGTPSRVADLYVDKLCEGYELDPVEILRGHLLLREEGSEAKRFTKDTEKKLQTTVSLSRIPLMLMCPHHLMPAMGEAEVSFEPDQYLVGIGVIPKLLRAFSRQFVLQENLTEDFVRFFFEHVKPKWVHVALVMKHTCMMASEEVEVLKPLTTSASLGEVPSSFFEPRSGAMSAMSAMSAEAKDPHVDVSPI